MKSCTRNQRSKYVGGGVGDGETISDKGETRNKHSTSGKPSNGRMGSCISDRKGVFVIDSDGDESFQSAPRTLQDLLIQLSGKGKSRTKGEEALVVIVQALTMELEVDFVENNFATLLYRCLRCVKKGSDIEVELASQAISLLGMILRDEDCAYEVYKDSFPVLSQVLESGSKKLKILECLAIVTFFGEKNDETQKAMQIIWKRILKADCNTKNSVSALAAGISAWSFLLTRGWRLSHKYWRDAISFLSNLLEEANKSVFLAAAEALALIFEIDCLDKLSTEAKNSDLISAKDHNWFKQNLKDYITQKLRCQAKKESEDSAKKEARIDFLKFFEDCNKFLEPCARIGEDVLKLLTWSKRVQLNFIKIFLGEDGFFTPRREKSTGNGLYTPKREEITIRFFRPRLQQEDEDGSLLPFVSNEKKLLLKKMNMSPNSFLNKARTRLLNKKRMLAD
ncbi:hypothetical protein P3X46_017829 [Hevea brasiliensis]|uniref:Interferon-related developmental regulator N-terminal domain-containing protein n=1 Tax=Hevea brasiliensis TaxID=3981 RepID=A0ABQ9LNW1_HEVBR|nr:hypothetical protein P3X46_017829 [Hevea brasiliensis]